MALWGKGTTIGLAAVDAGNNPEWGFDFMKSALTKQEGMYIIVQNHGRGIPQQDIVNYSSLCIKQIMRDQRLVNEEQD